LAKNAFRCFACGASGNQLDLWAQVQGLNLYEAAIDLCDRANVDIPWQYAERASVDTEKRNP
jgi:DNA primase